jgi:hypothetical protein
MKQRIENLNDEIEKGENHFFGKLGKLFFPEGKEPFLIRKKANMGHRKHRDTYRLSTG